LGGTLCRDVSTDFASYDELTDIWVRFADRDMFMRYTSLGVGHPVSVQKLNRDCLHSGVPADTMNNLDHDSDHEEVSDGEGLDEFDDEEESDHALSDEELEDEDGGNDEDEGGDGEEFDDLSF
jgi:hypothetical protein